ncbi:MAG: hypothetical protein U0414_14285 [Polyangiaceae bacterium]
MKRILVSASIAAALGALAALAAPFALQGCTDEALSPLPVEPSATTPPPDASMPPPDAPPPTRTVIQRNPYGNVAITDNLLWDGDFEWSSPFSDEYGWYQGTSGAITEANVSDVVVGPACHSGVKCARLKKNQVALGIAVASKDLDLEAWVHVRFEDDGAGTACDKAKVTLLGDGLFPGEVVKLAAPAAVEADGWCKLTGVAPKRPGKVYMQVKNGGTTPMLVDDAVIRPTSAAVTTDGAPILTDEDRADVEAARAMIRARRGPHDAPPNEARRSFDAWKKRIPGVQP